MKNSILKNNLLFSKQQKEYKILKTLGIAFFLFSLAAFICGSFYDLEINVWFAKAMNDKTFKIFVWVYEELGMTQSYLAIMIFLAVIAECYFAKKTSKIAKYSIFLLYLGWLFFWFSFNIYQICTTTKINDGFGVGISGWFLESYSIRQIILLVLFLIETVLMIYAVYYLRFIFSVKLKNCPSDNEYFFAAIKAFSIFFFSSAIVYIMKPLFGRPYFYSVDFENIFYSDDMKPEWANYFILEGHKIKSWGLIENGNVVGVPYLEWWQINDFVSNIGDLFKPRGSGAAGWWNKDFPSGHMISCFTLLYLGYFVINKSRTKRNRNLLSIALVIWFVHINIMQYTQIVSRTHWITDTTFSICLSLLLLAINGKIIDKIIIKNNSKKTKV